MAGKNGQRSETKNAHRKNGSNSKIPMRYRPRNTASLEKYRVVDEIDHRFVAEALYQGFPPLDYQEGLCR